MSESLLVKVYATHGENTFEWPMLSKLKLLNEHDAAERVSTNAARKRSKDLQHALKIALMDKLDS